MNGQKQAFTSHRNLAGRSRAWNYAGIRGTNRVFTPFADEPERAGFRCQCGNGNTHANQYADHNAEGHTNAYSDRHAVSNDNQYPHATYANKHACCDSYESTGTNGNRAACYGHGASTLRARLLGKCPRMGRNSGSLFMGYLRMGQRGRM